MKQLMNSQKQWKNHQFQLMEFHSEKLVTTTVVVCGLVAPSAVNVNCRLTNVLPVTLPSPVVMTMVLR